MFVAFGYKSEFLGLFTTRAKAQARMSYVYRNLASLTFEGDCVRFKSNHTSIVPIMPTREGRNKWRNVCSSVW